MLEHNVQKIITPIEVPSNTISISNLAPEVEAAGKVAAAVNTVNQLATKVNNKSVA